MAINWQEILEQAIIGKAVSALIDEGFRVEMSDQDGGGLYLYAYEGERRPRTFDHWARLTLGNGPDVLTDYTTNLETVLKPVNEFAAQFQQ